MTIETYAQALDFLTDRTNYESIGLPSHPGELTLDRIRALLRQLGDPQNRLKIIHVAGTKGKGSTSAMLAAILQQASYRTGLFTSPHLLHVEERVQVNGQPISQVNFIRCLREIEQAARVVESELHAKLTYFEIITALGFLHFAQQEVDVAVVEVGLGGRLDSTNVCSPLVSVITSISFDHMVQLGNTLAAIAGEKAGIIKHGQPIISGATVPEAADVISQIAKEQDSPLKTLGVEFNYRYRGGVVAPGQITRPEVSVTINNEDWPELELPLFGEHQAANAALAIACVSELRREGFQIPMEAVRDGLSNVKWPARLEVVSQSPTVVLDCAHNIASIQAAMEAIRTTFSSSRRGLIFACSKDKDFSGMLTRLVPHFERVWFTQYSSSARGAPADELADLWQHFGGGSCEVIQSPDQALQAARDWAGSDDLICVLGSVFLAGEIRAALTSKTNTGDAVSHNSSI